MRLRRANSNDSKRILALATCSNAIRRAQLLHYENPQLQKITVIEDENDTVQGFISVNTSSAVPVIEAICINPKYNGRGYEKALIKPFKNKYTKLKYSGKYATNLGFKGGELISKVINSSAIATNADKLKTRKEELDGVMYLVAPVVMVREQVLNGELLPADEIEKSAPGWNGRPVVVYHPQDKDGNDVIANDPEVVPKYEVGKVYNVSYDAKTTKLKGEVWIDISKAKRKNRDTKTALRMIENSEELEVSTGYIVNDTLKEQGEFDGIAYNGIQRDILPDHLALLPDEVGACSWEDGAGVRNNTSNKIKSAAARFAQEFVANLSEALGYSITNNQQLAIREEVQRLLREDDENVEYVDNILLDSNTGEQFAIYSVRTSEPDEPYTSSLYRILFTVDEETNEIQLGDNIEEVVASTQYVTKNSKEENELNKLENIVRDVIANSKGKLGRKDRSTLMNCTEDALLQMLPAEKRKAYTTKAKPATNETAFNAEGVSIDEIVQMTPEEIVSTISGIEDAAVLEEMATTLEEALATINQVLTVIDDAIAGTEAGEDPAVNIDISDVTDPEEDPEEQTVSAIATAARKARRNAKPAKKASVQDYINGIPDPEAREFIKNGIAEAKAHRTNLLSALLANKDCAFSEKELKVMETNQLEKVYTMLTAAKPTTNTSYAIRGMQNSRAKADDDSYIPMTVNIFKKEDK